MGNSNFQFDRRHHQQQAKPHRSTYDFKSP